jgi:hypothetical protein
MLGSIRSEVRTTVGRVDSPGHGRRPSHTIYRKRHVKVEAYTRYCSLRFGTLLKISSGSHAYRLTDGLRLHSILRVFFLLVIYEFVTVSFSVSVHWEVLFGCCRSANRGTPNSQYNVSLLRTLAAQVNSTAQSHHISRILGFIACNKQRSDGISIDMLALANSFLLRYMLNLFMARPMSCIAF